MNDEGTIAGWYTSPEVVPYGFIRTPDGKFISLSAPKAGTGAYLNQGTVPYTINNLGVVGGQYEDANNVFMASYVIRTTTMKLSMRREPIKRLIPATVLKF